MWGVRVTFFFPSNFKEKFEDKNTNKYILTTIIFSKMKIMYATIRTMLRR